MNTLKLKEMYFQLPSQGLAYADDKLDLLQGDSVNLRPFVAGDHRHMVKNNDFYMGYMSLMQRIVVEPTKMDFEKLLLSDAISLLFAARMLSLGPEYPIEYRCEACEGKQEHTAMLNEVEVRYAEDFVDEPFIDKGISLTLHGHDSEHQIEFHLARMLDEKKTNNMLNLMKQRNKDLIQNPEFDRHFVRFALLIDSIDGNTKLSFQEKFAFLDLVPPDSIEDIGAALNQADVGIQPKMVAQCTSCSWDNELRLQLTPDFFRSAKRVRSNH